MNKLQFAQSVLVAAMAVALFATTHQRNQAFQIATASQILCVQTKASAEEAQSIARDAILRFGTTTSNYVAVVDRLAECQASLQRSAHEYFELWEEAVTNAAHANAVYYPSTSSNFTNVITNTITLLGNDVRTPLSNLLTKPLIKESIAASEAEALLRDAREYGSLTNLVKLLAERGEFCRVQGHAWCADLKGYPVEQAEKPEWRECLVCGREEERARRSDKWHHSNP